ncbi:MULTISPECIES: ATP-binding cassette domain-containing protein [Sorangium]|uniref:ABC transporter, ATP-binding protein n=1 Tax=Sorangium cellulosum (strain So ce56) TaxID=448385 RepID=A9GTS8_SORC5|nr:ABC transporter ATP-binding protein [Sorangium cellulosum]CAN96989.1 ABC transporter, ATP-binding protein [Sorangium cellulosum So ce56]
MTRSTGQASPPVDTRSSLRRACVQGDVRRAALYLSLFVDGLKEDAQRRHAAALLPRLDALERKLAEEGLIEAHLQERDRLLEEIRTVSEWSTAAADPGPTKPLLEMKAVCRRFSSSSFALEEIDLEVRAREIVGVVGLNGSGKSTLLRIAAGRLHHEGKVSYPAIEAERSERSILARIAYVAQEPEPWAGRLGEHLSLLLAFHGITGKKNERRTAEVLEQFDLAKSARERWNEISGGLRARCALALAFAPWPSLIVLDEPMAYLDPGSRRWFLDQMCRLVNVPQHATGILVSSHLVPELEAIATRVLVLEQGRLVPASATSQPEAVVLDMAVDQPWRTGETLQRSLGLGANEIRIETRPDPRQVRITLPPGVHRGAVLRALAEHGITPVRFSDLTSSVARRL